MGRTLELTRTAAVEVPLPDPERIAALAKDLQLRGPVHRDERAAGPGPVRGPGPGHPGAAPDERRHHPPLAGELARAAPARSVSARSGDAVPDGMPAFPQRPSCGAPRSCSASASGAASSTRRTPARAGTLNWTARCLGHRRQEAAALPAPAAAAPRGRGRARGAHRRRRRHPRLRAAARPRRGPAAGRPPRSRARRSAATPATGSRSSTRTRAPTGCGQPCPSYRCTGTLAADGRPGVPEGLLPSAVLGAACRTRWSPPSTSAPCPAPSGNGWSCAFRDGTTVQRPERPVLHPDPGTRHRHRRPVRGHPRLGAASPGQLRAAGGPRGTAHRERVPRHLRRAPRTRAVLPRRAPGHDRGRDRAARLLPVGRRDPPPPVPRPPGRPGGPGPVRRRTADAAPGVGAVRRDRMAEPAPRRRPDRRRGHRPRRSSRCSPRTSTPSPPGSCATSPPPG